jgi:hypothetical protein
LVLEATPPDVLRKEAEKAAAPADKQLSGAMAFAVAPGVTWLSQTCHSSFLFHPQEDRHAP